MKDSTLHYLLIGDCTKINEIFNLPDIDLIVTSPPYFNAPFDYVDLFSNYESFLEMIFLFGRKFFDKLKGGAILALNIDDMLVQGIKYPIISDTSKILTKIGFIINGRIVWKKPDGYVRISQRSGVFLQNPYPMYYYPDNLIENILIFQKPGEISSINPKTIQDSDVWEMTNVLPIKGRLEEKIAAFPSTLPEKLIKLFTKEHQVVCDPFLGSGTTMKTAKDLKRNSIGIEIHKTLIPIIRKKTGFISTSLDHYLLRDELKVIKIKNQKQPSYTSKPVFHLKNAIEPDFGTSIQKFHLIILNVSTPEDMHYYEETTTYTEQLYPGRIILIIYNPELDKYNSYYKIFDFMLKKGIRFRDKITIWHQPSSSYSWTVSTNNNEKILFNRRYYEVLIFQKGKFNYKSVSQEKKSNSVVDKSRFQKEKWFLSIWDFSKIKREKSISESISRLIQLFLYNSEVLATNLPTVSCKERVFTLEQI